MFREILYTAVYEKISIETINLSDMITDSCWMKLSM